MQPGARLPALEDAAGASGGDAILALEDAAGSDGVAGAPAEEAKSPEAAVGPAQAVGAEADYTMAATPRDSVDYDMAIVTPMVSEAYILRLQRKLEAAGFATDKFGSHALVGDEAVLFLKIGVPHERLFEFACASGAPARLHPNRLREACASLDPPINFDVRPVEAGGSLADLTIEDRLYPPFVHIYAELRADKLDLYMPFVTHNRHKVIMRMLTANASLTTRDGLPHPARGAGLNPRIMDKVKPFVNYAAAHREALAKGAATKLGVKMGRVVPIRNSLGREGPKAAAANDANEASDDDGPEWATLMLLHEPASDPSSRRRWLTQHWIRTYVPPWKVPIHRIREYLGDSFGFYFLFLATFTKHCIFIGVFGVVIGVAVYMEPVNRSLRRQLPSCVYAPVLVAAMGRFFVDFKRQQATYAKEWGSYAWAEARPKTRPAFHGVPLTDLVYGKIVIDWPASRRRKDIVASWLVIGLLLTVALALIASIIWFKRDYGSKTYVGFLTGDTIATIMTILQVQILNGVYKDLARTMTRRENWKTDKEYADALTSKLVLFKFCNTFAAIIYTAFIDAFFKRGCGASKGGCLHDLAVLIGPLFLSGAGASVATQFVLPWVARRRAVSRTKGQYGRDDAGDEPWRVVARKQFVETTEYDNIEDAIDDYVELAVQFGYLSCFSAAFPASGLLCFCLNTIQLKQDGYKLLWFHRRPLPLEVRSIGVWEKIFGFILRLSIFSNCAIVFYTADVANAWSPQARFAAFCGGVLVLHAVHAAMELYHPALSEAVVLQLQRQDAYIRQVVRGVKPEALFDETAADLIIPVDHVSREIAERDHNDDLVYFDIHRQLPASAANIAQAMEAVAAGMAGAAGAFPEWRDAGSATSA